ncbi:hypothetical protein LR004_02220 [Candidatus Gracilibacteria bacterium]|nr:hypothetical protein [Candidatus Gracilibacteria bacterium]
MIKKSTPFSATNIEDLYNITLASANAKSKQIYIFEQGDLSDLIGLEKAEKLRSVFLENGIKVKQITNNANVGKFSSNDAFINTLMSFRYVPKEIFETIYEVCIFDDVVAIYNEKEFLVIENSAYADSQKKLFMSIWEQGESPSLGFDYKPNHSFFNCFDFVINDIHTIIWPDAEAKNAYNGMTQSKIEKNIATIIKSDDKNYKDVSYIICFIWSYDGDKMIDVWRFNHNHVDDRSGPLGDVIIYRNGETCKDLGIASGNTLLVLGYEEKLRRQSKNLQDYLKGPDPKLPLEIMNGKDFFA